MILQWFVGYKYAHIKIIIPPAGSIWGFFFKRKGNREFKRRGRRNPRGGYSRHTHPMHEGSTPNLYTYRTRYVQSTALGFDNKSVKTSYTYRHIVT